MFLKTIFSFGISIKSWPVMFVGRLVFGFGGESFTVANSALLADWFKGRELAFAFGINLSISKLGSVINNILSPALTEKLGIVFAFWFGTILCGFSIVCVLLTIPIDKAMDMRIVRLADGGGLYIPAATSAVEDEKAGDNNKAKSVITFAGDEETNDTQSANKLKDTQQVQWRDVLTFTHIFWILVVSCVVVYGCILPFNNISSSLLLERDYFVSPPDGCRLQNITLCESSSNPPVDCPDSKWYQPPLPYNQFIDGKFYPGQLTSNDVDCTSDAWSSSGSCTETFCTRLSDGETQASLVMSIPYIISAVFSPPMGFIIDLYGMRAVISAIAPMVLIIVHLTLGLTTVNPIGPLVGQGLAYTGFVSVLWPAVPLVVEEHMVGLAFGIVTSMQNLGCAVLPLVVAAVYSDSDNKYIPNVELLFASLAVVGFIVGLYMNYYDVRHHSVLNRAFVPPEEKTSRKSSLDADTTRQPLLENEAQSNQTVLLAGCSSSHDEEDVGVGIWTLKRTPNSSASSDGGGVHMAGRTLSNTSDGMVRRKISSNRSRGPSFTSYEEIARGGAFR